MAIGATGLTGANDNTDASSYVTPSISPAADSLLLVFYGSSISSGVAPTVTVSGLGLTWTDQDNVAFSSTGVRRVGVATA